MNKLISALLAATLLGAWSAWSIADDDDDDGRRAGIRHIVEELRQDVDQNAADIQDNAARIQQNAEKGAANMEATQDNAARIQLNADKAAANMEAISNNAADIADNFSQIQSNRMDIMDLDSRVSDLESAGPPGGGGGRTFIDVNCNRNPEALRSPPIDGQFPANTTYNIVGICNGPLYVTEDGVRFVGAAPGATILLPAGIPNASDGAVFADGAHDVRVQNLTIDASAWNSIANQGVESAGIYARNAFMRVIDTDIIGGEYGINPYRGGLVRLQGTVNITEFLNVGISAGDHSLVTTRGQVNISSTITEGSFMTGIELYRGGNMDFRSGVTVELPPFDQPPFPTGISASDNSHLRIRQGGINSIEGGTTIRSNSTLTMQGVQLHGNISLSRGASAFLFNVTQIGESNLGLEANSTLESFGSVLANANIREGATARLNGGSLDGAIVQSFGMLFMSGVSVTNLISKQQAAFFSFNSGNMNGNPLFYCGDDTTFFDETVSNAIEDCL